MQLALNLLNEEKVKKLIKEVSEEGEESNSEDSNVKAELSNDNKDLDDLEMLILQIEEIKNKKGKQKINSKDNTIKDIIKKINKKFKIKTKKKSKSKDLALADYLKSEFFNKDQYGSNIQDLFNYLGTGTKTDAYKAFYEKGEDKIYAFGDDMLSKEKQEAIIHKTKLARWMGYQGDSVYYAQDQVDAESREKWELIRNICFVHTLTMLRYEMSLS